MAKWEDMNTECNENVLIDSEVTLNAVFDHTVWLLKDGLVSEAMSFLMKQLDEVRGSIPSEKWRSICARCEREHDLFGLLMEDPFTKHAYEKPRGYAGDAELLDYIYGCRNPGHTVSDIGKMIFEFNFETRPPAAVRERCEYLARRIRELILDERKPCVMSVACGHARELDLIVNDEIGEGVGAFIGFDQDKTSLKEVLQRGVGFPVVFDNRKIIDLVTGKMYHWGLDFVYTAGLFDYLNDKIALRVTETFSKMLKPGGKGVIANLSKKMPDTGYMELVMDWHLIYRDAKDLENLGVKALDKEKFAWESYDLGSEHVACLEFTRL